MDKSRCIGRHVLTLNGLPRADFRFGFVLGNDELGETDPPNTTHTGRCVVYWKYQD